MTETRQLLEILFSSFKVVSYIHLHIGNLSIRTRKRNKVGEKKSSALTVISFEWCEPICLWQVTDGQFAHKNQTMEKDGCNQHDFKVLGLILPG